MIAGTPSHPPGQHEFNAGIQILETCLAKQPIQLSVHLNGYPKEDRVFDDAAAVVCYSDGGKGHPFLQGERLKRIDRLAERGVGIMCMHYAVEVPKDQGANEFRKYIGGCYEHEYSVNPMWVPSFNFFPDHPITRGVRPFQVRDEWYFNMRFRPNMQGVTQLLTATPTDATRDGPYVYPAGPYKHIQAAKGRRECMMWCVEREDGGRGVGFTGGHFHDNWLEPNFRKIVLNAILWIAKVDVPSTGVDSKLVAEDMTKNLDPKPKPAAKAKTPPSAGKKSSKPKAEKKSS